MLANSVVVPRALVAPSPTTFGTGVRPIFPDGSVDRIPGVDNDA